MAECWRARRRVRRVRRVQQVQRVQRAAERWGAWLRREVGPQLADPCNPLQGCSGACEPGPSAPHSGSSATWPCLESCPIRARSAAERQSTEANTSLSIINTRHQPASFIQSAPAPCIARNHNARHMDSSLHEVWQAAAGSPFVPTVGKDSQFLIAFVLLVFGFFLGGAFTLSRFRHCDSAVYLVCPANHAPQTGRWSTCPSSPFPLPWPLRTLMPTPRPSSSSACLTLVPGSAWFTCSVRSEFTSKIPKASRRVCTIEF